MSDELEAALKAAETAYTVAVERLKVAEARRLEAKAVEYQASLALSDARKALDLATLPRALVVQKAPSTNEMRAQHVIIRQTARRITTRPPGGNKDAAIQWQWNPAGYWEPWPRPPAYIEYKARLIIDGEQTDAAA